MKVSTALASAVLAFVAFAKPFAQAANTTRWYASPKSCYIQVISQNPSMNKQLLKFEAYGRGNLAGVYLNSQQEPYKFTFENRQNSTDEGPSSGPLPPAPPAGGPPPDDTLYEFWGYPAVPYGRYTDQLAFAQYNGSSLWHIEDVFRDGSGGIVDYDPPYGVTIETGMWLTEGQRSGLPGENLVYGGASINNGSWIAVVKPESDCSWAVYWWDGAWLPGEADKPAHFETVKLLAVDSTTVDFTASPSFTNGTSS